jgi:hypothetical protein
MPTDVDEHETRSPQTRRHIVALIGSGVGVVLAGCLVALTTTRSTWVAFGLTGASFAWLLTRAAPARVRPWCAAALAIGAWRVWSAFAPDGGALELRAPVCLAIPIIGLPTAFMFGIGSKDQTRTVAGVGALVVLAIVCSGTLDVATARVRVTVHQSDVDGDARRLLDLGETAQ